jgi:endonuclease YncB( thermonuclease family)
MSVWAWPGSCVISVTDGDTIKARLTRDLGFNGIATFEQKLRLNRINAPKVSTFAGKKARARVLELVAGRVDIETVGPYKYGDEWMAEIHLQDGRNLSDVLVGEGLAVYWDGTGPRPADEG